jgi:hypothetical protein
MAVLKGFDIASRASSKISDRMSFFFFEKRDEGMGKEGIKIRIVYKGLPDQYIGVLVMLLFMTGCIIPARSNLLVRLFGHKFIT